MAGSSCTSHNFHPHPQLLPGMFLPQFLPGVFHPQLRSRSVPSTTLSTTDLSLRDGRLLRGGGCDDSSILCTSSPPICSHPTPIFARKSLFSFLSNLFIPRFFSGCKPSPLFPRQPWVFPPLAARTARLARRLALFEPTFSGVTTQPSQKLVSQIISRTRSPRILSVVSSPSPHTRPPVRSSSPLCLCVAQFPRGPGSPPSASVPPIVSVSA